MQFFRVVAWTSVSSVLLTARRSGALDTGPDLRRVHGQTERDKLLRSRQPSYSSEERVQYGILEERQPAHRRHTRPQQDLQAAAQRLLGAREDARHHVRDVLRWIDLRKPELQAK